MSNPLQTPRRRRVWLAVALASVVVLGLVVALVINGSRTPHTYPTPLASGAYVGMSTVQPSINGSAYNLVYVDGDEITVVDNIHERQTINDFVAIAITVPDNLSNWRLCSEELTANSRAVRAYADAIDRFPHDAPNTVNPAQDKADAKKYTLIADNYLRAAAIAQNHGVSCVDDQPAESYWLRFTITVNGQQRQVAVPDMYVLLYVFESAEQIKLSAGKDTAICADRTYKLWSQLNAHPVDTTVVGGQPQFSEREKYRELEMYTARIDLEIALGYRAC